ncbi:MAG: hypothetical protein U0941_22775 [Planctomycetaceae bacterium]
MKILVTVLLTALLVFAVATAWVDYVQPNLKQASTTTAEKAAIAEIPTTKKRTRKPLREIEPEPVPTPTDEVPSSNATKASGPELSKPVADQLAVVKQQEADLIARQETLRMIYDDIRTELATVDELRKQASDDLLESERRGLNSANRKSTVPALKARPAPPVAKPGSDNGASRANALLLRKLIDEGKLMTAVSMLKSYKERDAARVLEAMDTIDPKLADRLATLMQGRDDVIRR